MKFLSLAIIFISTVVLSPSPDREYVKDFENGSLTSEGWTLNGEKHGYWKFYKAGELTAQGNYHHDVKDGYWYFHKGEKILREGFFKNDKRQKWWVFHHKNGYRTIKKQYANGRISGYVLYYKNASLSKVEEYKADQKLGEWSSYWKFKADHPDFSMKDLRN